MKTEKIMQHLVGKNYQEVVSLLTIEDDQGDCCGYATSEVNDYVKDLESSPSAVLQDVVRIDYEEDGEDRVVVNFIFDAGESKGVILGYELTAGSGSGWSYGAYCVLKCGDEEVAQASW